MRLNFSGADLTPLGQALIQRATENPQDACSLLDAGIIFQFRRNPQLARQLQDEALKLQRHFVLPAQQTPVKLRLLALMAPGDLMSNVPIECLLENSDIELHLYYATGGEIDFAEIPDHDVLFVAISETEDNRPILADWLPLLDNWPRPILNNPFHIERVARDTASQRLNALPGIAMPLTLRLSREDTRQLAQGANLQDLQFPLIVRPLDSHAGHDLFKVDTPAELTEKLDGMSADEFFVSRFVDYRDDDGQFRKYRVVLVDGRPFACHMGISRHWMIHYLNAGMAEDALKRAEEEAFMLNFDQAFAQKHAHALAEIHRAIGLDYLGIDCAESRDGRLLIFEVDHAMVVHAMDPVDLFPYKPAVMQKLFDAFRAMLVNAANL